MMTNQPLLEQLAAESLVLHEGELIFSKERYAELIVQECCVQLYLQAHAWQQFSSNPPEGQANHAAAALFTANRLREDCVDQILQHFGLD